MSEHEPQRWLSVHETAERLGTTDEMVRRKIRAGQLSAQRLTDAARAPWVINANALERQLQIEAARKRFRESGTVVAFDDAEFLDKVEARHGPPAADAVRRIHDRQALYDRVARDMEANAELHERFKDLDEDERVEHIAQERARRVREEQRIQQRALEILEEEDDG